MQAMPDGGVEYTAIAQAIKTSGAIVTVVRNDFQNIVQRNREPLVVVSEGGFFKTKYQYLCTYKGLFFHAKTDKLIQFPVDAEIIKAKKIWIPL